MKILISGFCAFAGFSENITEKIISSIPNDISGRQIDSIILPVEYENAFLRINDIIKTIKPDVVIATGMAASRKNISIERIALNIDDSDTKDNKGVIRKDYTIDINNDVAKTATLIYPNKVYEIDCVRNSYSAGTYVCNDLFYRLLAEYDNTDLPKISFIHFPSEDNIPLEKQLSTFLNILNCL